MPIRDDAGNDLPGVTTSDCGLKGGLPGVDNGRIVFDQVRIPRENLLNRYADVAEDGTYSSAIENPNRRFFTSVVPRQRPPASDWPSPVDTPCSAGSSVLRRVTTKS